MVDEIDDGAENVNGPLAVGQQEISELEIGVLDQGEHVLDLAIEVEDPDRIDEVVGVVQQLQRGEFDLVVGSIPGIEELGLGF